MCDPLQRGEGVSQQPHLKSVFRRVEITREDLGLMGMIRDQLAKLLAVILIEVRAGGARKMRTGQRFLRLRFYAF